MTQIHVARCALMASAIIVLSHANVARADQDTWGVTLEMPVLNAMSFHGSPQNDSAQSFDHTAVRAGPLIDEADFGPQVVGLIGVTVFATEAWRWGLRAGFAPTCFDGGPGGDGGKDASWQVEPFLGSVFHGNGRWRPFVELGPQIAHTCTGNTFDQGTALLFGVHAGGGTEYRLADDVSLQLSVRGLASRGTYVFYSHGETGIRWNATDLRIGGQLGLTFWL